MHAVNKILLEQDKCLVLQPELAKLVGRSAALLFQQIHYWLSSPNTAGIEYEGKKWIYNTYDDWANDLQTISKTTINRSIRKLKDLNLIIVEQLWARKGNRTNHYTINYDHLKELVPPSFKEKSPLKLEEAATSIPISNLSLPSSQNGSILYRTKKTKKDLLINSNTSETLEKSLIAEEKSKPLAQQMLEIWTRVISPNISPALNTKRSKYLVAALRYKFNNCLKKWEDYCRQIASSDFLMGKIGRGFQIVLETALKFDFIQRIFEKQFGVKDIKQSFKSCEEVVNSTFPLNESQETLTIRYKIANNLGAHIYSHWFADTQIVIEEKRINIYVSSIFMRDWIKNNYLTELENLLVSNLNILTTPEVI